MGNTSVNITTLDGRVTEVPEKIADIFRFFSFTHLPAHLQMVSGDFHFLACKTIERAPHSRQTYHALYSLLQAKDAAVRAVLG